MPLVPLVRDKAFFCTILTLSFSSWYRLASSSFSRWPSLAFARVVDHRFLHIWSSVLIINPTQFHSSFIKCCRKDNNGKKTKKEKVDKFSNTFSVNKVQTSHKISIGIHLPSSNNSLSEGALPWPPSSCTEPCRASRMTSDSLCFFHWLHRRRYQRRNALSIRAPKLNECVLYLPSLVS